MDPHPNPFVYGQVLLPGRGSRSSSFRGHSSLASAMRPFQPYLSGALE